MKHHGHHGHRSRLKSYLIVGAIAFGVVLLTVKVPQIRSFVYGAPSA